MDILEIIHLRTVQCKNRQEVLSRLRALIQENGDREDVIVTCYRDYLPGFDLSVHIRWKTRKDHGEKSTLGLLIANISKDYGLVHHSLWEEVMEISD